jgi:hypothetical protein
MIGVMTTYLYGSLGLDIYMKDPDEIPIRNPKVKYNAYCAKLNSLYGLK